MVKEPSTQFELIVAGLGGQGVLTIGRLLAVAGISQHKHVLYFSNYGPAMRGGECECNVTLSGEEISSPVTQQVRAMIVMDASMLRQFENRVKPGGMLILDSSVIPDRTSRDDLRVFYLPATKSALELGNSQVANLILLGAYLEATKAVPLEDVERELEKLMAGGRREALLSLNKEALREGARLMASY